MHCGRIIVVLGLVLGASGAMAQAKLTVSTGLDYAEGKYGDPEKSTSWTVPVIVKAEAGPWTMKLNIPYVRSTGTAAAGGDRDLLVKQTQSGLGDVVASATYSVMHDSASGLGLDVGAKIKFVTADKSKELLTTGKSDASLQAELYRTLGDTTLLGSLGWTQKGDPSGVNYRDPWYGSVGFSNRLSDVTTWGLSYDYRQRLTPRGDPISEATLFVMRKLTPQVKLQGYLVGGFSEASPDLGLGALLGYGF
jgi:hypothetical protein